MARLSAFDMLALIMFATPFCGPSGRTTGGTPPVKGARSAGEAFTLDKALQWESGKTGGLECVSRETFCAFYRPFWVVFDAFLSRSLLVGL